MGSLYKRGSIWWLKYYQDGRAVRESSETDNKTAARRMLKSREGDVSKDIPIQPKVGRVTFDEAAADVINDYTINKRSSLEDVQRRVDKHLRPGFGGQTRMSAITTATIRAFIVERQQAKAADGEINLELAALKRMFSLAVQGGRLHYRPHVPMLQVDNVRKGFLDEAQFRSVRDHLPSALQPIATFAYLTGWRKGEVVTLQWRHVDLDAKTVRLFPGETKNGQGRILPFAALPDLVTLFTDRRAETTRLEQSEGKIIPWVFHRNGRPVLDFRKAWETACTDAGVPGRLFHDLRRCASRNLRRAGVSESVAMKVTGHLTPSVFKRYDIVDETDVSTALGKLTGTVSGTIGPAKRRKRTHRSA